MDIWIKWDGVFDCGVLCYSCCVLGCVEELVIEEINDQDQEDFVVVTIIQMYNDDLVRNLYLDFNLL